MPGASNVTPLLLEGSQGPLFAVQYPPSRGSRYLLHLPPFAEEMNRARPMVAWQARALAAQGLGTLILDLYGTGDSAGEFGDATWDIWLENVLCALAWLDSQGAQCVGLWGMRVGALLALDAASRSGRTFKHMVFWQPVQDGKSFLTQFLRLRLAASMIHSGESETTADLRRRLSAGETLEVSGYRLHPRLAASLDALRMQSFLQPSPAEQIVWLEITPNPQGRLTRGSQTSIGRVREAGVTVDARCIVGEAFWTLYERTLVPELIHATSGLLRTAVDVE